MKVLSFIKPYQAPSARFIEMELPLCTGVSGGLNNYNSGNDSDLGDDWE